MKFFSFTIISIDFLLTLTAFNLCSCNLMPMSLEVSDISRLSVIEEVCSGERFLNIKGFAFHSAYNVGESKIRIRQNEMIVNVHLYFNTQQPKTIDLRIVVPDQVHRVVMGREKVELWDRVEGSRYPVYMDPFPFDRNGTIPYPFGK